MAEKHYTEVTLMGKNYVLGGAEDETYLQRVATYVNSKAQELKKTQGFLRQTPDFQNLMLVMNLADDYFKAVNQAEALKQKQEQLEQEIYDLKHELVASRMRRDET